MQPLNASTLLEEAEQTTGLSNWGGAEFLEPLTTLITAINNEALLTESGVARARKHLLQRLCMRLSVFDDRIKYPDIANETIEKPVMIVGLPRTGTTYMHSLLGADPANIAPLGWQLCIPSPPPNLPSIAHQPAIDTAHAIVEQQGWNNPKVKAIHDYGAVLSPDECYKAFELSFHSLSFVGFWNIPSYLSALPKDCIHAYGLHKKILQALQYGSKSRRWMLKAPEHTLQIESLLAVYPDAVFIQNHRDPSKVMASIMSLIKALQSISTDKVLNITRDFSLAFMQSFASAQESLIEMRKNPDINKRFIDVQYLELEQNPIAVMKKVYSQLNMPFTDTVRENIQRWINENRKGKHGKHSYSLGDVNVTKAEVRDMFSAYINQFNIALEN